MTSSDRGGAGGEPVRRQNNSRTEPLTLTSERAGGGVLVLHVGGPLDLLTSDALRQQVRARLDDGVRALVLDLEQVSFLGCAGLAVLDELARWAEARQLRVRVVATSHPVLRSLEVVGLDLRLEAAATVEAAVSDCS
ncbi:STAS domain-containing protein [Goodfellowiella coeruleoviolacea]|uniref:Anti-sigma factor antagonist n=1 Tax=Goodfellowiella coeruleoviolacea TaxID=334858 RepID=A0AAE3KEE2_9PSEU|nr:STAS domain-containing protein [Goodfellowiella coeruleoviolacea]MCP2163760.1 anti-sigma B factor antagonist [Goodfellowiella coeruleoviolacea]